jgi:hypothetical protein
MTDPISLDVGPVIVCPVHLVVNKSVSGSALRLWLYLQALAAQRHPSPSRSELATWLDVNVDSIDRWLSMLQSAGALIIHHQRTERDGWKTNEYTLSLSTRTNEGGEAASIPLPAPVSAPSSLVVLPARSRARQAGVLYKDILSTSTKKDAVARQAHPRFAAWWKRYPRKVRKQAALKIWLKLSVETDDDLWSAIMTGTQRYAGYWKAEMTDPRYIPHPTTFLSGARWEDEVPVPQPKLSTRSQGVLAASARFLKRHQGEQEETT